MKILSIEAERIKRLRAVKLNLDGGHMVVVGRPDQGKTTALDLVWMALQTRAVGPETVSHGAEEGKITVVLGDPGARYTVVRRIAKDGSTKLSVKSDDGGKFGATFLDTLVSNLTFDPTIFARVEGKAQRDMLLKVVRLPDGVSIESLDEERAKVYTQRTDANRDLERAKAKLPAVPPEEVQEVKAADVIASIETEKAQAEATNAANKEKRERLAGYRKEVDGIAIRANEIAARISQLEEELAALRKEAEDGRARKAKLETVITKGASIVEALQDIDLVPIINRRTKALEEAEETNKRARAYQDYLMARADVEELAKAPEALTAKLAEIDERKKSLLDSVEWPVPGLGIRDGAVTYGETLLSQCGMSVRMRVSCAIAMAMNPKLNTIRIDEGESLGAEGREELLRWAAERDFQVLMTVVKDGPAEDGELEIVEDTLTNVSADAAAPVAEEVVG